MPTTANSPRALIVEADGEIWRLVEEPAKRPGYFMLYTPSGASTLASLLSRPYNHVTDEFGYNGKFYMTVKGAVPEIVTRVVLVSKSGATLSATLQNGIFLVVTSEQAFVSVTQACADTPFLSDCPREPKLAWLQYFVGATVVCAFDLLNGGPMPRCPER